MEGLNVSSFIEDIGVESANGDAFEISQCTHQIKMSFYHASDSNLLFTVPQRIILTIIFPFVFLVGFIGNAAFLLVLVKDREMRTMTNYYLAHLALADIINIILAVIRYEGTYIASHGINLRTMGPYKSSAGCAAAKGTIYMSGYASTFLVTLVTLERFLAICYPVKHRLVNSFTRTKRLVAITWFISFIMGVLIAPAGSKLLEICAVWPARERYTQVTNVMRSCVPHFRAFGMVEIFLPTSVFLINLVINCVFYVKIIHSLRSIVVGDAEALNHRVSNRVTRMLLINGLAYFLCVAPIRFLVLHHYVHYVTGFRVWKVEHDITMLWASRCLSVMNSSINPFIYGATNQRYRQAFRNVFRLRKSTITPIEMSGVTRQTHTSNVSTA